MQGKEIIPLGSHDMFLSEVVNIKADEKYFDPETGKFDLERAKPLVYVQNKYYGLEQFISKSG